MARHQGEREGIGHGPREERVALQMRLEIAKVGRRFRRDRQAAGRGEHGLETGFNKRREQGDETVRDHEKRANETPFRA